MENEKFSSDTFGYIREPSNDTFGFHAECIGKLIPSEFIETLEVPDDIRNVINLMNNGMSRKEIIKKIKKREIDWDGEIRNYTNSMRFLRLLGENPFQLPLFLILFLLWYMFYIW